MMKKRKLALAAAVWMAVAGVGFVNSACAAEADEAMIACKILT